MINQLKVEKYKLQRFWLLYIAILVLCGAGGAYGYVKLPSQYETNGVFSAAVADTSFMFLISLVTSWFMGNDFGTRTIHNEIKIGYSRLSILISRGIMVFFTAALLHVLYILATVIGFCRKNGFDKSILKGENVVWLLIVLLQIIAVQSFIMLIVYTVKKPAAAISASICFSFIGCNILRNFFDSKIFTLSCFCFVKEANAENLVFSGIYAFGVFLCICIITYILFRKAEIK